MIRRLAIWTAILVAVLLAAVATFGAWFLRGDGARLALERQASQWLGQPVRIGSARAALLPRIAIRLAEVTIGDPASVTFEEVDLSTSLRPLLSRRLEETDVVISGSRLEMPLPFSLPAGASSPEPGTTTADGASPMQVVSVRRITLRDVTLVSLGREVTISMDSSLEGSRLDITRLTGTTGAMTLEAKGRIDLEPQLSATFEATADMLDFDDLLALSTAFSHGDATGGTSATAGESRISARISAPSARAAGVELSGFEAAITSDQRDLTIDPLSFTAFGGEHTGWLSATLGDTLDVRIGSSVENVDVGQLAAFGGIEGAMTGRLSATARVGASGRDIATVLATARGVGDVSIVDGTIRGLDLVRTVVLFFGRPDASAPPSAGQAFTQIKGSFALGSGRLNSDDLTLTSQDVDILARGSLTLETKALDGRGSLMLSDSLSAQAGTDLYRYTRSGNRVLLPATIGGTLSAPRVGIDAAAALRRGIENEVERRLRNFFERIAPS